MAVVSGVLNVAASFAQTVSSGVVTPQTIPANINFNLSFGNGTSAGNVDLIYARQLSLAGTATTLDLTSLTDLSGASINFARVRLVMIQNLATTAGYIVTVGAAAATQWTGYLGTTASTVILQPNVGATSNQNVFTFLDAYSVGASTGAYVDSTHKSLKLDPGANTIAVNILLLGCSAVS